MSEARPTLTRMEAAALAELNGRLGVIPYVWRQTSMRQLAALGLVEQAKGGTPSAPAWGITDAGRWWLEGKR